ncbi:hypothetical protein HRUBRA_01098 [Pseudohaliea rubra DSM 19751]|uniref:Uncharacterized protein n=1 Tax=Pseudohaliea rubra DSM 19751 TaxID=1265313 RepID=A0A095X030_9GAMM|nr:hypothetical protein HRUBRA_01098 [Pseudohaliea rubra DSM 19751]
MSSTKVPIDAIGKAGENSVDCRPVFIAAAARAATPLARKDL